MSNPVRPCIACGKHDDHPREQVIFPDGSSALYHHDCGALMDPPIPSCTWLVQHKGELKGDAWRDHVNSLHESLSDEQRALAPHERDAVESHIDGKVA